MISKSKVIRHASKMFAESGVKAIRMDDVAKELSISKRTLYEMFADKEELLYDCAKYMIAKREKQIEEMADIERDGLPALIMMFCKMLDTSELQLRMQNDISKHYPELYARLATESRDRGLRRLRDKLIWLLERGLISPTINVDLSVTMFYYSANGVFSRGENITLPEGITLREAAEYMFINFFRGIATQQGAKQIDDFLAEQQRATTV